MAKYDRLIKDTNKYEEISKKAYVQLLLSIVFAIPFLNGVFAKIKQSFTSLNNEVNRLINNVTGFMSSYGFDESLSAELKKVASFNDHVKNLSDIKDITSENAASFEKLLTSIIDEADAAKTACYNISSRIAHKEGIGAATTEIVEMFTGGFKFLNSTAIKDSCQMLDGFIEEMKINANSLLKQAKEKMASIPATTQPTTTPSEPAPQAITTQTTTTQTTKPTSTESLDSLKDLSW